MEAVAGLMRGMKLSEEERRGVKIKVVDEGEGEDRGGAGVGKEIGKRRALEDGPWMFEKDLMVVEDYDPGKRLEEYDSTRHKSG
ncbi:hypothetical protein D1007_07686 [Hordeum vulgare]|nr:hypothetical protein D1007_07686 [Hordeum vulgare]